MIPSIHFSPFWSINNISYTNHHKSNLIQFKTPNLKQNTKKPTEINTKTNKLSFTTAFTCPNVNNFKTLTHKIVTKIEKFYSVERENHDPFHGRLVLLIPL
jgi:hypothetical protein